MLVRPRIALVFAAMALAGCRGPSTMELDDPARRDLFGASDARAPLPDLEFLSGSWRSFDGDDLSEEVWTLPHGDSMIGTFRMTAADGSLKLQESLAIVAEPGGTFLRLRHLDPKMVSREEKDAPIVLALESHDDQRAVFRCVSGSRSLATITYWRVEQTLHSEVAFTPESKREPLTFSMRRPRMWPY